MMAMPMQLVFPDKLLKLIYSSTGFDLKKMGGGYRLKMSLEMIKTERLNLILIP